MNKTFDTIVKENQQFKIGIYFGIALTLISLTARLKTILFEFQTPYDWLFVFLVGLFIFFLFMGIAFNTEINTKINEYPNETGGISRDKFEESRIYLKGFNKLSKTCFCLAGVFGFFSLIRLCFIIWKI